MVGSAGAVVGAAGTAVCVAAGAQAESINTATSKTLIEGINFLCIIFLLLFI
jgi:hypothetical protein